MKFPKIRELIILAYLIGDALTYRHLVRIDPTHALEMGTVFKNLGVSLLWPLYWIVSGIR
jgi:hypothetical protein